MNKVIFITGVAGMIGSNLAHYILANSDYIVVGIDNLSGGYKENLPPEGERFTFYRLDLCDPVYTVFIERAFKLWRPDIVYHCAAYAAEGLSPFIRRFNYTNNVVGTMNIVNNCIEHSVERLVFFSSIAVYGTAPAPYRETYVPEPIDPYGVAKYACELDIKIAGQQHGLDWVIVRPFNVYGERQNLWDKYRNVLGIWMYNYLNGKPIQIYGDGKQIRSFTYIGDILGPLLSLGVEEKYAYNVMNLGNGTAWSLNSAAQIFKEVVGDCEIQYLPARHEVKLAWCDTSRCEDLMDPTPLFSGMTAMWEWAKTQPPRERMEDMVPEITTGLYEHWK